MKVLFLCIALFSVQALSQDLPTLPQPTPKVKNTSWCAAKGKGEDTELNLKKNRIDKSKNYFVADFDVLKTKGFPSGTTGRRKGKDLSEIYKDEGKAIMLEGYLLDWVLEGPEKCNCDNKEAKHQDYHLWLIKSKTDSIKQSVVVELAPRMRDALKGRWIKKENLESDLNFLKNGKLRVRVYGWLLFDGEHRNQIDKPGMDPKKIRRATLWEIHPVTKIESYQPNRGCKDNWCELQ